VTTVNDSPAGGPSVADTARRGQTSWRTTVAAGFLGLALVGGLVVALSGGYESGGHDTDTGAAAPAAVAPADPAPAGDATEVEPAAPVKAALGDVTWELVSGRAVPSSPTGGPTKINGPVHAGFAHTQDGAVLAALNIATRALFTPGEEWRAVAKAQVEPGKGRNAMIKERGTVTEWTPPPGGWGQTAGYRIASYTDGLATIEEAFVFTSGELRVRSITVIWRDNDWHLVPQANGNVSPYTAQLVGGLTGFTRFSGGY
jgi:hypothetical protein